MKKSIQDEIDALRAETVAAYAATAVLFSILYFSQINMSRNSLKIRVDATLVVYDSPLTMWSISYA